MEITVGVETDPIEALPDFDPFFRAHFEKVARAAALIACDAGTGQDMAQEAFARLFERWADMESVDHARNFAYQVAANLARSHLRKNVRVFLYGLKRSPESKTMNQFSRSEDWLEVSGALAALSPRQRACVVLVDYADMDSARAARALGMTASTVRVHLMRGRRALRQSLGLAPILDPKEGH